MSAVDLPNIARICRIVEGMPLAVELAAGSTRTRSLAEIVDDLQRGDPLAYPAPSRQHPDGAR